MYPAIILGMRIQHVPPSRKGLDIPNVDILDVPCTECRADNGVPCLDTIEAHAERVALQARTIERLSATGRTAQVARRAWRNGVRPRLVPLAPCGTASAYRRHLRRNETPCLPCLAAHATACREYQHRKKG